MNNSSYNDVGIADLEFGRIWEESLAIKCEFHLTALCQSAFKVKFVYKDNIHYSVSSDENKTRISFKDLKLHTTINFLYC